MKIIMTESSGAMGGQELAVLLYAEGLRARGHDLSLIVEPGWCPPHLGQFQMW